VGFLFLAAAGVAALGGPAAAQSGEGSLALKVEPGLPSPGGGAVLPLRVVDRQGRLFPARAGEISVEVDGRPLPAPAITSYDAEQPYALRILVDPSAFRGVDARPWCSELAALARNPHPGESVALWAAGGGVREWWSGEGEVDSAAVAERLADPGDVALWDDILQALDRLAATPAAPDRRVLLVISDGVEGRESRHPVATCADGADTTRVSVWCVSPRGDAGDEVGRARLRGLTDRTGGGFFAASPGRSVDGLRDALAQIRGTQALRVSGLEGPPPFSLQVRANLASARGVPAGVAVRRSLGLSGGGPFPWIPAFAAVLAALAGGAVVARRRLPVGRVTVLTSPSQTIPVTRRGLTIGGAHGNGLVLGEPRISRSHAVIRMEEGKVMLVDLRSSNGTKVNGRRIGSRALRDGDRIVLADAVELEWRSGFGFDRNR